MTRYITKKETQRIFDKGINELLEGSYDDALQRYKDISEVLKERAVSPRCYTSNFRPHYLISGFGLGLAEGMMEKSESTKVRDIADIATSAKNFYDVFQSIGKLDWSVSGFEAYRALGKCYASLGLEKEGIGMLERLRQPRIVDVAMISSKARELSGDK